MSEKVLSVADHRRDSAGLTYVYPVVSRRAKGVSIGINLNVNRACNWGCVYCQVEGLTRGGPPAIDLALLERELKGFLTEVLHGDYLSSHVAEGFRRVADVAFSGDGEPTSAAEFSEAVLLVVRVLESFDLLGKLPVRLITNGSLVHRAEVRHGLEALAAAGGEVWFKVDRADQEGMLAVNKSQLSLERVVSNLRTCATIVPTWVQTCWFVWNGKAPDAATKTAYLALIAQVADVIQGIHLYGLARPSQQPEREQLARLPELEMQAWARQIEAETQVRVMVSP